MRNRQFCTPHLVTPAAVTALERVVLNERSIRESWFQNLLFKSPSLIPIDEIEPLFGSMIAIARELPTGKGPADIVYINPQGYLTLVETKLFRNPEARREVVAQILDYAAAISKWTYQDLCDTVSENLARGRFMLLIVGDGIHSGVEHLVETLAATPQLGFSLALVELALFKTGASNDDLFVQPRVLARTREVVRAVVEVRAGLTAADIKVLLPEVVGTVGPRPKLTVEVVLEGITKALGKPTVDKFRQFLAECEKLRVEVEARDSSLTLAWYEPNTERRFAFASIYAEDGSVDLRFVRHNYRKIGLDQSIGMKYVNALAALVPGAKVRENVKDGKAWPRIYIGEREITLADLLPKSAQWLAALQTVIQETEAAGAAKQIVEHDELT